MHAGCDKQDSLMRGRLCDKLRGRRRSCCSHCSNHRSISQILAEHRDFCLLHLHFTPPLPGEVLDGIFP